MLAVREVFFFFFFSRPIESGVSSGNSLWISYATGKHRVEQPTISRPMRVTPHLGAPRAARQKHVNPQPVVSTTPHTSAWTQVADRVDGRHPTKGKAFNHSRCHSCRNCPDL